MATGAGTPFMRDVAACGARSALAVFDPAPGVIGSAGFTEVAETLTRDLVLGPADGPGLYGGTDLRALVHQAAGMVSVQLDCPVDDALELIKAHAFAEGTSAQAVAARITRGELRLG